MLEDRPQNRCARKHIGLPLKDEGGAGACVVDRALLLAEGLGAHALLDLVMAAPDDVGDPRADRCIKELLHVEDIGGSEIAELGEAVDAGKVVGRQTRRAFQDKLLAKADVLNVNEHGVHGLEITHEDPDLRAGLTGRQLDPRRSGRAELEDEFPHLRIASVQAGGDRRELLDERIVLAVARENAAHQLAQLGRKAGYAVAGIVMVHQRPGSAKGVMFITLENETGIANLVVWPTVSETPDDSERGHVRHGRPGAMRGRSRPPPRPSYH